MAPLIRNKPPQSAVSEAAEERSVSNAAALSPKLIYEVIRREGRNELNRTNRSVIWSGISAGMLISLSVLGEAIFRTYLPEAGWRYLVENIGYSLGFIAVIMGRMQLFTENTITTVLPLMQERSLGILASVARLWTVVLSANVVGAFGAAALFIFTPAIPAEVLPAMIALSEHATGMEPIEGFWRGIPAGVIVALIVWMLPEADEAAFFLILTFTWLIAAGDFTHIVAGSVEMAVLVLNGSLGGMQAIFGFFLPVLLGNIIGGTLIFTLVAWGQVRDDVEESED
ncbi:formate/nitrite transporter family protein [Sulfitobacter sp. S0837]|uniref:formate/nitrite transporter family protein n=1 Tax=Sulfitobacter maritimus TaxID=2741719 RepID=UPI0015823EF3|nr:formate/nitrite transporter family protein [Sulfitobacter maritimus]NUH67014.1 formate/nitrite transporter family protein [Sulfitobacter maritimus]